MGNWQEMSGIVFDKTMPIMLKSAEYKTAIRPVPLHGSDTWTQRKAEQNLRERTDRRMLRRMMGIKRIEQTRSEYIRTRAVRCGKHESEHMRSDTEVVRPCGEKD